jgi:hypothetical protein
MNKTLRNIKFNCSKLPIFPNLHSCSAVSFKAFSTQPESPKERFFLDAWITDFPMYSNIDYPTLANLASRSQKIGVWFENTKQAYILSLSKPAWFLDDICPGKEWSEEMTSKLLFVKGVHSARGPKLLEASLKLKKEMNKINSDIDLKIKEELKTCPELVLELFTISVLPIETHFKSLEFRSKEEAKEFLEAELLSYKVSLFKKFSSGDLSSDELINMLYSKP